MQTIETIKFPGRKGQIRVIRHTDSVVQFNDTVSRKTGEAFNVGSRGWAVRFGMTEKSANFRGVFPVQTAYAAWELAVAGMKGGPI